MKNSTQARKIQVLSRSSYFFVTEAFMCRFPYGSSWESVYAPTFSIYSGSISTPTPGVSVISISAMQENDLLSVIRRKKYTLEAYKRRKEMKDNVPENLLQRNFFSGMPRKIFVTDITYLYTSDGIYYLNVIEDLFNREIVAWKIGASPDAELCIETVKLLAKNTDLRNAIIHSDQGTSYTSYEYRDCLISLGIRQSCSAVGECWDNAAMESFNSILKTETLYNKFGKKDFKECKISKDEVFEAVDSYVLYYNNFRQKALLGNLTPREYLLKNPRGTLPVAA